LSQKTDPKAIPAALFSLSSTEGHNSAANTRRNRKKSKFSGESGSAFAGGDATQRPMELGGTWLEENQTYTPNFKLLALYVCVWVGGKCPPVSFVFISAAATISGSAASAPSPAVYIYIKQFWTTLSANQSRAGNYLHSYPGSKKFIFSAANENEKENPSELLARRK